MSDQIVDEQSFALISDQLKSQLPECIDGKDSRRLFHGRGRYFPGLEFLCIDWYAPAVVVTLFDPVGPRWESGFFDLLRQHFKCDHSLYVQRRYQPSPRYDHVYGPALGSLVAQRGSLRFALQLKHQNIGYFLDTEPARLWLEALCLDINCSDMTYSEGTPTDKKRSNKKVLNLFSYTCSFSVVASYAGADSVVNMDLSSKSLSIGRKSYHLNSLPLDKVTFFANDILKSWSRLKRLGPYDIVIIDPPSFQKGSFIASRDYKKILRRMEALVASRGQVLCCLNSPEQKASDFKVQLDDELNGFKFKRRLQGSDDFPDVDAERALKMFVYQKS